MPRPKQQETPTRNLRPKSKPKTREYTPRHLAAMVALVVAAIEEDVSFYVGASTATGMKKFRFYLGDENVEDSFSPYEDPEEVLQLFGDEVFGSQVTRTLLKHLAAAGSPDGPQATEAPKPISKVTKRDTNP